LSLRSPLDFLSAGGADVLVAPPTLHPVANRTARDWYERYRNESNPP
jgi:hypothetical protein